MKIWGEIPKISGIYDNVKKTNKIDKAAAATKKDVLSISEQAKDYQTAIRAMRDVPDIRTEKVAAISEKYESGKYDVNGRDIAEKILKSLIDFKA